MPQAFICYSSKDTIFADLLRMKLKEGGVEVWKDEGSIHAGDEWREAIDQGIRSADVCLVVITPSSCSSPYVTYEWSFALGRGVRVIPLLLETAGTTDAGDRVFIRNATTLETVGVTLADGTGDFEDEQRLRYAPCAVQAGVQGVWGPAVEVENAPVVRGSER